MQVEIDSLAEGDPQLKRPLSSHYVKVIFTSYAGEYPEIFGTWILRAGVAVCDSERIRQTCENARPININLRREVVPSDGEHFLKALPTNFSGSVVRAELFS